MINRIGYKDGDKLFPNKKRPSDFSAFVIKIFTKNTYKHVTATNLRSIYLTDYYNSGQKTEEEYNKIADMMAHSRKQQGQYKKIIKDDNPDNPDSSVSSYIIPSSVPSVSSSSSTIPFSVSSSSSSSTIPFSVSSSPSTVSMPDDQFKEFMGKLCGSMYENMFKHMYAKLYNDIKSEVFASLPKTESTKKTKIKNIKNTKGIQLNSQIENPTDDEPYDKSDDD